MSHWSLAATPWAIFLGALLWIVSGWVCFANWKRSGKRKAVARLEVLRFLLITLLAFTLLRPEWVQLRERTSKPEIAILLDASTSMETKDLLQGTTVSSRADWVEQKVRAEFWKSLEKTAKVVVQEFSPPPAATNASNFKGEIGTDLNQALESVLSRGANLKAVMVISDGDWNLGKSPIAAASRYRESQVPIFSATVGSERPLPDVMVEAVSPPAYGLFGEQITIPFTVRNNLDREVKTTVTLSRDKREETRKEITLPPNGQVQDTVLWFPRDTGEVKLQLSLPIEKEEALPENNARDFEISVRAEKLKVLVVDSLPRWEYRYLRNALARDPGVEMHSILFHPAIGKGGGKNYLNAFPGSKKMISQYDVIFLGDVGVGENELTANDAELIKGLVEQQSSGLVFIPGRRGRQATFATSALADLMPVLLDASKPEGYSLQNESTLSLTANGKGHLLTRFETDENQNAYLWQQLPGFFWSAAVEKSRPGSEVLGVHSSLRNAAGRLPLLAIRAAGSGKVLFMGTDSAWRWRRGVEDKYHYRFWSQVVRWMAHQRHLAQREGIRLTYSPETPRLGDTLYLQATVLNQAGFPVEEGNLAGTITTPSGRSEHLQFTSVEGGWGVFKSNFTPQEGGKYKLVAESAQHGRKFEAELDILRPDRERLGQPVNRAILQEIASITGGTNVMAPQFDELLKQISVLPEPKPLEQRIRLWSSPYWGGAILGLLALYWIGRKMAGMI
ncbi:MAG: hypothetical protein ACO1QB_07290 [Verrucomicrobiales bacterium]